MHIDQSKLEAAKQLHDFCVELLPDVEGGKSLSLDQIVELGEKIDELGIESLQEDYKSAFDDNDDDGAHRNDEPGGNLTRVTTTTTRKYDITPMKKLTTIKFLHDGVDYLQSSIDVKTVVTEHYPDAREKVQLCKEVLSLAREEDFPKEERDELRLIAENICKQELMNVIPKKENE